MEAKPILQINMLGGCSLQYGDKTVDDASYHTKKSWTLLEYLIIFRSREIPVEELMELLYPGDRGTNPSGALKTLVYRVRSMLEELGLPDSRDMILVTRGSYAWNTSVPMVLDADRFELACQRASAPWMMPEEKLATCLEAVALYKGDFLSKSMGESWVVSLSAYYHSMYVHLVQTTIGLLMSRDRWEEVISICSQAILIDGYEEYFYYYLIRGLVKTGRIQQALEQYKRMYNIFYTELGVTPSAELAALYREICRESGRSAKREVSDLPSISRFLLQDDRISGAFFCELEVFKDIYSLEARSVARSKRGVYLALISASMRDGSVPPLKMLNNYMDKLGDCIQSTLRRGDVVSKYSISQYILLLPTSSSENGRLALGRITSRFLEKYPRCPLVLRTGIQEIEAVEA
ncbi:MAG: SARP family transcriptional regulator [Oscillospiraceae bacterium]|nr:SARP family transcriptional regulator [Oscillospiraceae bacterium]